MKAGTAPDVTIDWRVLALDLASGKELWSVSACKGKPRSRSTPRTPGPARRPWRTRMACTRSSAPRAHWRRLTMWAGGCGGPQLGVHPMLQGYGTGSSPAILDGRVFVQSFSVEGGWLACFDAKSGKELWRATRDAGTSWSTPLLWKNQKLHRRERVESRRDGATDRIRHRGRGLPLAAKALRPTHAKTRATWAELLRRVPDRRPALPLVRREALFHRAEPLGSLLPLSRALPPGL